ncbi:hypothetical protein D1007_20700 [Hordeum vulgare]|nr:hypothetical protein D1007_20700 [Hordeum vulgare]
MAEARGDVVAAIGDVVELHGAMTADEVKDVGGVHGGAGKLATAADVEKEVVGSTSALAEQKVMVSSGAVHLDTPDAQPGKEQEYDSGEDVYKGNVVFFTTKKVEKIRAKGVASFYNRKIQMWHCPYCTTKPKPKDGHFDHLVSHAEDVAIRGVEYMIGGPACRPREGPDSSVM